MDIEVDIEAGIAGGIDDVTGEDIGGEDRTESGEGSGKSNRLIGREGTKGRTEGRREPL